MSGLAIPFTRVVLATTNAYKVAEIASILGPGVTLLPRPDSVPHVDEVDSTIEGNAVLKARALADATSETALADDTGLFVSALDGAPGVRSARYGGDNASYADNRRHLIEQLRAADAFRGGAPRAAFRCAVALAVPEHVASPVHVLVCTGVLTGSIIEHERGDGGFGYDPLFVADATPGRTLAELSSSEKNRLSHRRIALDGLSAALA